MKLCIHICFLVKMCYVRSHCLCIVVNIHVPSGVGLTSDQCCQDVTNCERVMSLCFQAFDKDYERYKSCFFNGHTD